MSNVNATGRKYRYRLATGEKLLLFKHTLLSFILVINRIIVIKTQQKNLQLQLQSSTFQNFSITIIAKSCD